MSTFWTAVIVLLKLGYLFTVLWITLRLKDEYPQMFKKNPTMIILSAVLWPLFVVAVGIHLIRKKLK